MAATAAETSSTSGTQSEDSSSRRRTRGERGGGTRLDNHIDKPSVVEPGDAPFDTLDPNERATSVTPDKATAAQAGHGTVNAVVPLPEPEREDEPDHKPRIEKYKTRDSAGKLVSVEHNLDTGETKVS